VFYLKKLTSKKIDPNFLEFYLKELRKEGAQVLDVTNPFEAFRLKIYDTTIIAYNSGKITYLNIEKINNLLENIDQRIDVQMKKNKIALSEPINTPNITSMKIKKELIPDLVEKMTNSAYKELPIKSQYESHRYNKENFNIIIYKSGSIVYNIEPEILVIFRELLFNDYINDDEILIGQDEAGKGEWWGPMTIASVAMKVNDIIDLQIMGAMDSKKLNDQKIANLFTEIQRRSISMRIIPIGCHRFNELYKQFHSEEQVLDDLLAWGHAKALKVVIENSNVNLKGSKLIIDEFNKIKTKQRINYLVKENNLLVTQEHKADLKYPIVSIASICAKHVRNLEVKDLERKFNIKFQNADPKELSKIANHEEFIKIAYIK